MLYVNPVFKELFYTSSAQRTEVVAILANLVTRYQGVMPQVEAGTQVEIDHWDRRASEEKPRLVVSWKTDSMNSTLYERLEKIFAESVLDSGQIASRTLYREKKRTPPQYLERAGNSNPNIRGYPIYRGQSIRNPEFLSNDGEVFWVAREFPSRHKARETMRRPNWFYDNGHYILELRLAACKEIELVDTALRVSVALNGSYDQFDRYEALTLAQKQLSRRQTKPLREEDIIGLENLINDVKLRQFLAAARPEEARALGISAESVLLVGVPGTGKSSIAQSLLWDPMLEQVVFVPLNVKELLEASYGSEKYLDTFFNGLGDLARRYHFRTNLWCDDLESAFLRDHEFSSKEMAVAQSALLNHLQGINKNDGMRISGSTNYPEKIDPRFLEFGRISYMFHVQLPRTTDVVTRILQTHIRDREQVVAQDVDIEEIAARSLGFTPRMLVGLINEAGVQAARRIFGTFTGTATAALEVTAADYRQADAFLRTRSDVQLIARRDEEIAAFVERHNQGRVGFV